MLSNISWQGYWISLALITAFYYAFVFIVFFRKSLLQRFREQLAARAINASTEAAKIQQPLLFERETVTTGSGDGPEYIPAVRSLVDEVHAFFESMTTESHTQDALAADIKTIIRKYPSVKGTPYQHSVNNLILFLAEQNGGLHLSAEEVGSVWL